MEWVRLGDIVDIKTGKLNANAAVENGKYPFFTTAEQISRIDTYSYDDEVVLVAGNGDLNVKYYKGKFDAYQRTYILTLKKDQKYLTKYIYYFMSSYIRILRDQSIGGVIKYIKLENLTEAKIPDISLDEQEKMINLFEKLEKLIKIRQDQIQALDDLINSSFYQMFGDVRVNENNYELKTWKDVLFITNGKNQKKVESDDGIYPIYGSGGIMSYATDWITKEFSVIIGRKGNINSPILVKEKFWNVDTAFGLEPDTDKLNPYYLYYFCKNFDFERLNVAVTIPSLRKTDLYMINIPLPPIEKQNKFADLVTRVEGQKGILEDSLSELSDLFASLMQDAFDGSLGK